MGKGRGREQQSSPSPSSDLSQDGQLEVTKYFMEEVEMSLEEAVRPRGRRCCMGQQMGATWVSCAICGGGCGHAGN